MIAPTIWQEWDALSADLTYIGRFFGCFEEAADHLIVLFFGDGLKPLEQLLFIVKYVSILNSMITYDMSIVVYQRLLA